MAKGQMRSNRKKKKPEKAVSEKPKVGGGRIRSLRVSPATRKPPEILPEGTVNLPPRSATMWLPQYIGAVAGEAGWGLTSWEECFARQAQCHGVLLLRPRGSRPIPPRGAPRFGQIARASESGLATRAA